MKVLCLFPITNNANKLPEILEKFRDDIAPELTKLGATKVSIAYPGTDYVYVPTNQTLEGVPKGKGILEAIKNTEEIPNIIICCDGSGAIPYNYIIDIFQELVSDSSLSCVMANRIGDKCIDDFRYFVERFEIFMIKEYYNYDKEIADGQCGLWCYRNKKISCDKCENEIKLTAQKYDIEIDLVSEVLKNKLSFSFVDIELPKRQTNSSFKKEDSYYKVRFLFNKLINLKQAIPSFLEKFEKTPFFDESIKKSRDIMVKWGEYKKELISLA